jgi:hypothetical protein
MRATICPEASDDYIIVASLVVHGKKESIGFR